MALKPNVKGTTKQYTSIGMLKAILNDPNNDLIYNEQLADMLTNEPTTASIRQAGQFITAFVPRMNQFANALVNMIGLQRIEYLMWTNPWAWAKQGKLEMGESVEQIWIGLASAYGFNSKEAETRFLKQTKPDINAAYYRVNYAVVYPITMNRQMLQRAFTSMDGLVNLVETVIATPGRTANIDEFAIMKYTLAVTMLDGGMKMINIPEITKDNADDVITTVTTITNNFQFPLPGKQYNRAGVENTVSPENTMILESTKANAFIKVNALASAYNIDEVKFMGNVVMHDGIGNYDWKRMAMLFSEDPTFQPFTEEQIAQLNSVDIIAMDRKYLQIYDNYEYMGEPLRNGDGLFENFFYHVSKVLATSPFHNAVGFTTVPMGEVSISLSPETATASPNQTVVFQANVQSTGFNNLDVIWTVEGGNQPVDGKVTGNQTYVLDGILYIGDADSGEEITVTAISVADSTKTAAATVTVA